MRPVRITVAAGNTSAPIPLDIRLDPFSASVTSVPTGGATVTLQYTSDDVFAADYVPASGAWQSVAAMTAEAATKDVLLASPCTAVRFVVGGTGSASLRVTQAGL